MSKQRIQLSDHFTYSRLLRFVLPCIGTMLFTSIYGIVDGLCVSNFVGKTAFAAVNLIMPLPMLLGTIGFMLGTGGSAIVGITLGEGDQKKADRYFTLFLLAALVSVSVLAVLGIVFLRPIAVLLGAKGELLDYAVRYGRILMVSLPTFALQNMFQSFFVTAEKPHLGFWFTVGAGCTNMVLDVLMVGIWGWGVEGAAIATFISQLVGGVLPVFYFIDRSNSSRLHLCKTSFYSKVLRDACINGSSELMTNLSMSLVNILYNFQLLRLAGENGVAAYGVIMYAAFLFVAVFVGYAVGSAPIVSFHYGAGNRAEVHNLYEKSLRLIAVVAVTLTAASMVIIPYVARFFVGYDPELLALGSRLLHTEGDPQHWDGRAFTHVDDVKDFDILADTREAVQTAHEIHLDYAIKNTDRATCTMLSGLIARKYGEKGLPDSTINIKFKGSAGQSFGAFLTRGVNIKLEGEANDYFAKGLSGGRISILPPVRSSESFVAEDNIIAGNTGLYGATSGELYVNGQVGERFAVRNSGATAVVEGAGDHCCEYMTGGRVVVLGQTGRNFAAGMSGGVAYVWNKEGNFDYFCNMDMVELSLVEESSYRKELHELIRQHWLYTGSRLARLMLDDWNHYVDQFIQVVPIEYKRVLQEEQMKKLQQKIADIARDY